MLRTAKTIMLSILTLVCILMNCHPCFALEIGGIQVLKEIELPQDLNFSISNTCTEHAYFEQAAAGEDGSFAVYSLHVNPNDASDVDFAKRYIDIYNPDGTFLQELSFTTPFAFFIELNNQELYMYFYDSVLVYNRVTQELLHYAIPDGADQDAENYDQLHKKEFTVGNWTYRCKKSLEGYKTLIRSDNNQKQILIEMPGKRDYIGRVMVPGCLSGILIIILNVWYFRKKKRKTD